MMGTKGTRILIGALAGLALLGASASAWLGVKLYNIENRLKPAAAPTAAVQAPATNGVATVPATNSPTATASTDAPEIVKKAEPLVQTSLRASTNGSPQVASDSNDAQPKSARPKKSVGPVSLEVVGAEWRESMSRYEDDGKCHLRLFFNKKPDLQTLKAYVSFEPKVDGVVFEFDPAGVSRVHNWTKPAVFVKGDFPYAPVTVRVKEGCPASHEEKAKSLEDDFLFRFQRADPKPSVRLAESGRYLPPGGKRLLAVESINVATTYCAAAAIPAANIVQILAREENQYRSFAATADSEETEDLSDKFVEWKVPTHGARNTRTITPFALRTQPNAASNGVFLVVVRSADTPRCDYVWSWEKGVKNRNDYRLVCLTDLGLTVRRSGRTFQVWTTSLTTGSPVPLAEVEIYASNNRLLGRATSNAMGLAKVTCTGDLEPFAVIVQKKDGSDRTFLSLMDKRKIEEIAESRESYLKPQEVEAFLWTERDIYRHDEPIFVQALLRTGTRTAPKPFPIDLNLFNPDDKLVARKTVMSDAYGSAVYSGFTVPAEYPSGKWQITAQIPGKNGRVLGTHTISIEEFVPPQVRVTVTGEGTQATNFAFTVKAENLYGGPARNLGVAGAVVFEDATFVPKGWTGWSFGDETRGLKPSWRRLCRTHLDTNGVVHFTAPILAESGLPKAAVKAIGEGTVFEVGGRAARGRCQQLLHYYPYYIGSTLGGNVRLPIVGQPRVKVACVRPDGTRLAEARTLRVMFQRIQSVYSCKVDDRGWTTWTCDRVAVPCEAGVKTLVTRPNADVELEIPFRQTGDYEVVLVDEETRVSFGRTFWLGDRGDDDVRAPLANPSAVTLSLDKKFYRPGDVPRLLVKAPFAGWGCLSVMRDQVLSTKVVRLEGPTAELTLDPVSSNWTPCVDVALSVVQSAENGGRRQAARAHGLTTLMVRCAENEIPVTVKSAYQVVPDNGGDLTVDVVARGPVSTGDVAVVTVVDEGIHLLTNRREPAPIAHFGRIRTGDHPLIDLFDRLLPVWDGDPLKVTGFKTGGDMGAEMLGRVSPVPSRRFKPLALWRTEVPLTNGTAHLTLRLPEFVGEVRVTAFAYSKTAVGVAETHQKVTPKLIVQPDAPRFAAPLDRFNATLTLANRSGAAGEVTWTFQTIGTVSAAKGEKIVQGKLNLAKDDSRTFTIPVVAAQDCGTGTLVFRAEGLGERHTQVIELPVRPAAAPRETAGVVALAPGETKTFFAVTNGVLTNATVRTFRVRGSELAKLNSALAFLAEYPHGCLEQTTSQIFPLIAAGGLLNTLPTAENALKNRADVIDAGVKRVLSMLREKDFVMWPDCNYAPWDREVSVYAAHFLLAADKAGHRLPAKRRENLLALLRGWSNPKDAKTYAVAAYACQTLALAGYPQRDAMLRLYDASANLTLLARARLARAFVLADDRARAQDLLRDLALQPQDVREATFTLLALLDLDANDARLPKLIQFLESKRRPERYSWGTTGENAHALMALAAYYRHHPAQEGVIDVVLTAQGRESTVSSNCATRVAGVVPVTVRNRGTGTAWLTWREIASPTVETLPNETTTIAVGRTFFSADGEPYDLAQAKRGDLVVVCLSIASTTSFDQKLNDLVIEDLLPAAFEPVLGGLNAKDYPWIESKSAEWIMRTDARDDRVLVFSKKFELEGFTRETARVYYPVRIVSSGAFVLPGTTVEAMYAPEIRASLAPSKLVIRED